MKKSGKKKSGKKNITHVLTIAITGISRKERPKDADEFSEKILSALIAEILKAKISQKDSSVSFTWRLLEINLEDGTPSFVTNSVLSDAITQKLTHEKIREIQDVLCKSPLFNCTDIAMQYVLGEKKKNGDIVASQHVCQGQGEEEK